MNTRVLCTRLFLLTASIAYLTEPLLGQAPSTISPVADHHAHLQSLAVWPLFHEELPVVELPADLDRVLRGFERGWQSSDKRVIAELFTEDGLLQWGDDWVQGPALRIMLLGRSGGLRMRAQAFEAAAKLGYIAGAYGYYRDTVWVDQGRFLLALRRSENAEWRIAVGTLRNTTPPTRPVADPVPAHHLIAQLDSAGVRHAAAFSLAYQFGAFWRKFDNEEERVQAENDWVGREVSRYPGRLVGFCSLNPLKDYALNQISRCVRNPSLSGLKLHFTTSGVDLRNRGHVDRLRTVFRAANDQGLPIAVHMRTLDPGYGRADAEIFLREVLVEAPHVTVQIAHLAGWGGYGPETDAALAVFAEAIASGDRRTANVIFDISAVLSHGLQEDTKRQIVERIRQIGVRRMLFAVDGMDSPRNVWAHVQLLPLTDEELRIIASNRAPYFDGR